METADFGPVDDFRLFFADNLFTLFNICEQTNLFAEQFFDNPVNCSEHIELVLIIFIYFLFFFQTVVPMKCNPLKGLFVVVMTTKADMWQIIRLIRSSIACDDALLGTLSKVDKKPWGRRPEVKIPPTVLLRMLHSSSTWSSERENAIFTVQAERRENVSINLCIFILFKKRIYVWLLKWRLDIP